MKLSVAIRLGSMLVPQCIGQSVDWHRDVTGQPVVAACALGAAGLAIGQWPLRMEPGIMRRDSVWNPCDSWPWTVCDVACPQCCVWYSGGANVVAIIAHLNDTHRWTREQIADWIATIEPQEAPATTPEQHEEVLA